MISQKNIKGKGEKVIPLSKSERNGITQKSFSTRNLRNAANFAEQSKLQHYYKVKQGYFYTKH